MLGVVTHVMPTRKRKLFIGTSRGGATVGVPDCMWALAKTTKREYRLDVGGPTNRLVWGG